MRVTDAAMFQAVSAGADAANSQVQTAQNQVSSGLAFTQPGQAPAAAGDAILEQAAAAQFSAINSTVTSATAQLNTASGALSNINDTLNQATTLAEELANGDMTASQRTAGATQVQGLISQVIAALNTQQGSTYVFGGTADTSPPFSASGQFTGNDQTRSVEVAPGVTQDYSVSVGDLMTGTNGGANVLGTLQSLQTALANNDVTGIQTALDGLQTGTQSLNQTIATAGSNLTVLGTAATASQDAQTAAQTQMASLTNADVIQASTNLALAQQALQAALAGATQTFHLSLVDQLGASG